MKNSRELLRIFTWLNNVIKFENANPFKKPTNLSIIKTFIRVLE